MDSIKRHVNSIFNSVSYRVGNILLDPGDEWEGFKAVDAVLLTHAHFDHIYGINRVIELNPDIQIYTNLPGKKLLMDSKKNLSRYHETPFVISNLDCIWEIQDGQEIMIGDNIGAKAVFTPGHNPSCITWLIGDMIFTGDSYIPNVKTIVNLPQSNKEQALASEQLVLKLSRDKTIYPGHDICI